MISFNMLGSLGHLGNQMFQIASPMGIAANTGQEWVIRPNENFGVNYGPRSSVYECFELPQNGRFTEFPQLNESVPGFDETLFNSCPNDIDLVGYFQSYKYFENIKDKLPFNFKKEVTDSIAFVKEFATMHVRRTDYLMVQSHLPQLPMDYYTRAMKEVDTSLPLLIFSDDPAWCEEQPEFGRCEVVRLDPYATLYAMTKARINIIANSSFSWWGAYLNGKSEVIAPGTWFGPALPPHDIHDIILPEWNII